jgi:PIN domain nuclease of toxin-antitoxin system
MRLLLDTHILLWFLGGHEALSSQAHALISDTANAVYVSSISLWEIAVKATLGKLNADANEIRTVALGTGFLPLAFTLDHAIAVARLPSHHRDPFDRALIAQAQVEPLYLLTHDHVLVAYGTSVILV